MRKKLLLTVAVVSALGINSSAQALGWDDAKSLFNAPVTSNPSDKPTPVPDNQLPGESEPNNSAVSADPINSGVEFTGQLFSEADKDWFRFETTQNNAVVTIQTSEANGAWSLTLVDRAGNTIASSVNSRSVGSRLGTDDPTFRLSITAEKAGTYYLVVQPSTSFVADPYRITVTISDPTNPDNPVIDANFNDLETEPNNGFDSEGLIQTDPLASGKILLGQLLSGGDEDWFEIDSPGNEIIDIDFCGFGSPCEDQTNRIVMVLKKEFIDEGIKNALSNRVPVDVNIDGRIFPAGSLPPYIEYLGEQGLLGDALIGKIHPDFGQSNFLEIGIYDPGTYYFVVAGKLQRDSNGAIDTHIEAEKLNCGLADTAADDAATKARAADTVAQTLMDAVIDASFDLSSGSALKASEEAERAAEETKTTARAAQEAANAAKKAALAATAADVSELAAIAASKAVEATNAAGNAKQAADFSINAARQAIEAARQAANIVDADTAAADRAEIVAATAAATADAADEDAKKAAEDFAAKKAADAVTAKNKADISKNLADNAKKAADAAITVAREARKAADAAEAAAIAANTAADTAKSCDPETAIIKEGPFVIFEAFNDDQYSISIRRTSLSPHTPGTPAFVAERERATFDNATGIIHIPELEFNGTVFEAELIHREDAEYNLYELLQIREITK